MARGNNYHTVSVIGCQSSGKSTLLNALFDCQFEVLNQQMTGHQQTTQGIWVSKNSDASILVLDIEGNDSLQRGE